MEIHINLQMLYLFLLAFITGVAGTIYSEVLIGVPLASLELLLIFYTVVGFVIFMIIPQESHIGLCKGT